MKKYQGGQKMDTQTKGLKLQIEHQMWNSSFPSSKGESQVSHREYRVIQIMHHMNCVKPLWKSPFFMFPHGQEELS